MSIGNSSRSRTAYLLKRAESAVRTEMELRLQPLSVTPAQYVTLSLLKEQGDQSSAQLARKAGIMPQSMSETIASLERKGLIDRTESPEHRRILITSLTASGIALLAECDARLDALEKIALANVLPEDVKTLRTVLRSIIGALSPNSG